MRPSAMDIDTQIINAAALLFAAQGFDRTSVQQVADAVGYSKTGLLHRFSSKQALRDAVDGFITETIDGIFANHRHAGFDDAGNTAAGAAADSCQQLLRTLTETAITYPGVVQYLLRGLRDRQPEDQALVAQMHDTAETILALLVGRDADDATRFRALLALETMCSGVVLAQQPECAIHPAQLGPLLVSAAHAILREHVPPA